VNNVPNTEIAALQDLYDATNGDTWNWDGAGNKWNFTDPNPCADAWQGVNCSQIQADGFLHVVALGLYDKGLVGSIPSTIGQLEQLEVFDVGRNALTSTVPNSIGQLTQLAWLYLDFNQLTGAVPSALGQLTLLEQLALDNNLLSGAIPDSLQHITQLTWLYLFGNLLTGTIPIYLGLLTQVTKMDLGSNLLSGTIPDALQQLTQLTELLLHVNHLTGTVPASLGQLTQLTVLDLDSNLLSGTIPDNFQQLTQLTRLYVQVNQLTGTIPAFVGMLVHLRVLQLGPNQLTGPIPEVLAQLAMLEVLYIQGNGLTGTMPASLGQLVQLRAVSLGSNQLHGTIPQSWTDAIQVLHLQENHLSGPIPESLGYMPLLLSLDLSSNSLTRSIPASFQQLGALQVLMLHNNQLRGNIAELFSPSQQSNLSTVQLGGNQLTGILPAAVFLLPSLSSFAAVDNCFEGPLPEEAICSSGNLRALVLDGLHSAPVCRYSASLSHKDFNLGPLPQCLLSMTHLTTLHLSGSGLTGSIPANANISAVLNDLSLSHNLLTGRIPESILERDWEKLDLSYNRLAGTTHFARVAPYGNTTELRLQHNRLSGVIPGSMRHVGSLSIVENNIFSCRVDRSDVPQQDTESDKYTCGSDSVDNTLYTWLGSTVAIGAIVVGIVVYNRQAARSGRDWLSATVKAEAPGLGNVIKAAHLLATLGTGAAVYCVAVLLPVYAVVDSYHPSFTYKYAWTVSGVFLTGTAAFVVEAVFWLLQLPICAFVAERFLSSMDLRPMTFTVVETTEIVTATNQMVASVAALLLSLAVVTGINVAFVIATLNLNGRELTVIQILLAVFKLGFNNVVAPALQDRVRASGVGHRVTMSQVLLALLNVIVIPCLAVMVISPACFYDALKGTDAVTSSYEYDGSCQLLSFVTDEATGEVTVACTVVQTEVGTTSYTPPFTYSYQCSSSFVTSYAPTFVIMCIISGFVLPAYHLLLLWLRGNLPPTSRLNSVVTAATPRIQRELPSPQNLAQARSDPLYRPVFDANKLVISLVTYLALLLTFGALFPPLAVCCAVAMASVVLTARLEVGRYVSAAVAGDRQDCLDEVESACAGVETPQQLRVALYLILTVSCLFYTLFLFDTLGYEVGFVGAFWVLIVLPLLPALAWALQAAAAVGVRGRRPMTEANKAPHTADPEAGTELTDILAVSCSTVKVEQGTVHGANDHSGSDGTARANPMHIP
jgi:Leucine-rich repeat (LRR) protein